MDFDEFFVTSTGHDSPFDYQRRLGTRPWPELLDVPTGLGKTAGVVSAWLFKQLCKDPETPKRLIYCLPMRVLAEQTYALVCQWVAKSEPLFKSKGACIPSAHLLMGGEIDIAWAETPENPAILVGTQDMVLSRALMRGYGMSRFAWPVHFALLHNDAFWVFDEIQLMGAGLATSAQIEGLRRSLNTAKPSRSLWVSATLSPNWLDTIDLRPYLDTFHLESLTPEEMGSEPVRTRREAVKSLSCHEVNLTEETSKKNAKVYISELAASIIEKHQAGTQTLVVLNTVERAQALYLALQKDKNCRASLLQVHSRFRPEERRKINAALMEKPDIRSSGRIIVATQAVEAGVDITCKTLFTELAPWSSMVQRFGRCNRYGEWNLREGGQIFWMDLEGPKLSFPYEPESLEEARSKLGPQMSAAPADLPPVGETAPLYPVIRRKDFIDLFNTDPDLTGFDVDISPYIRDADDLDVQVFWRDLGQDVDSQPLPHTDELCRASIAGAAKFIASLKKQDSSVYIWDGLDNRWRRFANRLRPGLILMANAAQGGYRPDLGFRHDAKKPPVPVLDRPNADTETESYGGDRRSYQSRPVPLPAHLSNAAECAATLAKDLGFSPAESQAVQSAATWHDIGKAHPVFQATLYGCTVREAMEEKTLLAKSALNGRHSRKYFRHELASMLAWLEHGPKDAETDLVAYLIAAHHGKVRLSLRSMPNETSPDPPFGPRYARGVWEGDCLPSIDFADGLKIRKTKLRLDLMELGQGPMGPSWTARTQKLLQDHGPFSLSWLEAMVRIADWRASRSEQENRHEK